MSSGYINYFYGHFPKLFWHNQRVVCVSNRAQKIDPSPLPRIPFGKEEFMWLVVSTPLKNMSSSIRMIILNIWENTPVMFQENHQPVMW